LRLKFLAIREMGVIWGVVYGQRQKGSLITSLERRKKDELEHQSDLVH
jgi:hypothetical protein